MGKPKQKLVAPSDQIVLNLDAASEEDVVVFELTDGERVCLKVVRDPYIRLALVPELVSEAMIRHLVLAAQKSLTDSGSRDVSWLEKTLEVDTLMGMTPEDILESLMQLLAGEATIRGEHDSLPNIGGKITVAIPRFAWDGTSHFGTGTVYYTYEGAVKKVSASTLRNELIRVAAQMTL